MSARRPRILYITPVWPRGKAFGGQLRALHIGRALKHVGDLRLLVVNSDPNSPEVVSQTCEEFELEEAANVEICPNRGFIQKVRWAVDTKFLNLHGCLATA